MYFGLNQYNKLERPDFDLLEYEFPLMELGLNYIRFGYEEKKLFQFLLQTNQFSGCSLDDLIDNTELTEILQMVSMGTGCEEESAKELFLNPFVVAHGCASLLANNAAEYEKSKFEKVLGNVWFKKEEVWFAVVSIIIYAVVKGNARSNFVDGSLLSVFVMLAMAAVLTYFIVKNRLSSK